MSSENIIKLDELMKYPSELLKQIVETHFGEIYNYKKAVYDISQYAVESLQECEQKCKYISESNLFEDIYSIDYGGSYKLFIEKRLNRILLGIVILYSTTLSVVSLQYKKFPWDSNLRIIFGELSDGIILNDDAIIESIIESIYDYRSRYISNKEKKSLKERIQSDIYNALWDIVGIKCPNKHESLFNVCVLRKANWIYGRFFCDLYIAHMKNNEGIESLKNGHINHYRMIMGNASTILEKKNWIDNRNMIEFNYVEDVDADIAAMLDAGAFD